MFRQICVVHVSSRGVSCFWVGVRTISVCVRQNFCFGMLFCFFPRPSSPLPSSLLFLLTPNSQGVKEKVWKPLTNEPLPSRDHVEDRMLSVTDSLQTAWRPDFIIFRTIFLLYFFFFAEFLRQSIIDVLAAIVRTITNYPRRYCPRVVPTRVAQGRAHQRAPKWSPSEAPRGALSGCPGGGPLECFLENFPECFLE